MNLATVFLLYKKGALSLAFFENTPSRILEKFVWKRLKIGNFLPSAVKFAKPHIPYFPVNIILWISFLQLFHRAWKQRFFYNLCDCLKTISFIVILAFQQSVKQTNTKNKTENRFSLPWPITSISIFHSLENFMIFKFDFHFKELKVHKHEIFLNFFFT
jgi:hypothetical protein